jgi:protease I
MKQCIAGVLFLFLACGTGEEKPEDTEIPQIAKSVLMVIAHTDFRDDEFTSSYDLLKKSGIAITVASTDTTPARGSFGMAVTPDIVFEDVVVNEYDAIIVIGGSGCKELWDNEELHDIITAFHSSSKTIAAICLAPVVLGRAGILKDINATVHATAQDEIGICGGVYTGSDVEVCSNIITCSGPQAAKDFAKTVLSTLANE